MDLEPRHLRDHVSCDNETRRLQCALDIESRHNAVMTAECARLTNENRALRSEASQAAREREEAIVALTKLLNLQIANSLTEPARALNGIVA